MNILPKKRWHVRTKDNIARVRRDEALAAEEERKKQQRLEKAEREAKREALRQKARQQFGFHLNKNEDKIPLTSETDDSSNHVNLFYELAQNEIVSNKTNPEYEKEKQLEKEKYEKQIGYLTYLGQDTNEILGKVSWYNKPREKHLKEQEEVGKKQKVFEDPLKDIRKYVGSEDMVQSSKSDVIEIKPEKEQNLVRTVFNAIKSKKKRKKHKKEKKSKHKKKKKKKSKRESSSSSSSSSSSEEGCVKKESNFNLEKLRAERLKREREERRKAEELLAKLNGVVVKKEEVVEPVQKYNSQFNPHLAKQNYIN